MPIEDYMKPFAVICAVSLPVVLGGALAISHLPSSPSQEHNNAVGVHLKPREQIIAKPTIYSAAAKTLIVGIDRSKSDSDYLLGPAALGTSLLIARLDAQTDRVLVFRVENDTDLILGPEIPHSSEDLQRALVEQLMADPKQPGSFSADFWEKTAIAAEKAPGPVVIAFYTDGDAESAASASRITAAAKRLADNKKVRAVCVYGRKGENSKTDAWFAALGDRFRPYPPSLMNTDWLFDRLESTNN